MATRRVPPALRGAVLPMALLTLIVFGVLHASLLTMTSDRPHLGGDIILQFFPFRVFLKESLARGELLLWNPHTFSGVPGMANPQRSGLFYPDPLWLVLPVAVAFTISQALHLIWAGLGTYLLAHRYTQSRAASLGAALAFTLSGYYTARVGAGHIASIQSSVWLPWAMLALEKTLTARTGAARWAIIAGVCVAFGVFGGHPETVFFIGLALALRAGWEVVALLRESGETRPRLPPLLARVALVFMVAGGLSAIQLLPTLELVGQSARADASADVIRARSLPPYNVATLLLPEILGSAALSNAMQGALISEAAMYTGVLSVLLAAGTPLVLRRNRIAGFYAVLALLSLVLALGGYTPFYGLLRPLPGFKQVGSPLRFVFLTAFTVPLLAAFVLQSIQGADLRDPVWRRRIRRLALLAFGVAALAALATLGFIVFREQILGAARRLIQGRYADPERQIGKLAFLYATQLKGLVFLTVMSALTGLLVAARLGRRGGGALTGNQFVALAVLLLTFDVLFFNYKNAQTPAAPLPRATDYHVFLRHAGQKEPHRFLPLGDLILGVPEEHLLAPVSSVLGYDPIILREYRNYLLALEPTSPDQMDIRVPEITRPNAPLLYDLNVKYILSRKDLSNSGNLRLAFNSPATGIKVYEKTDYGPRAYVAGRAEVVSGGAPGALAALRADREARTPLRGSNILPSEMVAYVEQPLPSPVSGSSSNEGGDAAPQVTLNGPNRVTVRTSLAQPGLLVLNDVFFPGWKARDNGQAAPLIRVNGLFRGVPLGPGQHTVEFIYAPASLLYGAAITLATLALVLAGTVMSLRRERRNSAAAAAIGVGGWEKAKGTQR